MFNAFVILCAGVIAGQFVQIRVSPETRDRALDLGQKAIAAIPRISAWVKAQRHATATQKIEAIFAEAHRALETGEPLPEGMTAEGIISEVEDRLGEPLVISEGEFTPDPMLLDLDIEQLQQRQADLDQPLGLVDLAIAEDAAAEDAAADPKRPVAKSISSGARLRVKQGKGDSKDA